MRKPLFPTSPVRARACKALLLTLLGAALCGPAARAAGNAPGLATGRTLLDGQWEYGLGRNYTGKTIVPGIPLDPGEACDEKLWYRREVALPAGNWTEASLELYGARFMPEVYVDGQLVSKRNGGMTLTVHPLGPAAKSGRRITLEVALTPLSHVPVTDASYIPSADQWRSNISACLWDDVVLHTDGGARITRIVPFCNLQKKEVAVDFSLEGNYDGCRAVVEVIASDDSSGPSSLSGGRTLLTASADKAGAENACTLRYSGVLREWTPDAPNLYRLRVTLLRGRDTVDISEQNFGIKSFTTHDKSFRLNGNPCTLRGSTVVWHRWVRDSEGRAVAYDTTWFKKNIIDRLKSHGTNYLRFHLGVPPQRLLDLCDRYGLLVQYEWSFFHGMPASYESLMEQYPVWFDRGMAHPSVAIYHPYNETSSDELATVWRALDSIVKRYPSMLLEDRDELHIHKYWWSLFENVGVYYDSAAQFDRPIVVDEFGGNYLDGNGNIGGYSALKESFMRFLGREQTPEMRLRHQTLANARVAEYWRRIGAAGIAPFVIASSWEDGNTWFMGPLREGNPKPVWDALTAAWSPVAASLDIWDRDFTPGQAIDIPLYVFNETGSRREVLVDVYVRDGAGKHYFSRRLSVPVDAYGRRVETCHVAMPDHAGDYFVEALTLNPTREVTHPVLSSWDVRVLTARVPDAVKKAAIYIPPAEKELAAFARERGLRTASNLQDASVVVLSRPSWKALSSPEAQSGARSGGSVAQSDVRSLLEKAVAAGKGVLMLDAGERNLGQGYPKKAGDLGPLQGAARVTDPEVTHYELCCGLRLTFTEEAEPESHIHPAEADSGLWQYLKPYSCWLWNGLRGGLIVPASDMEVDGLSSEAFLSQWSARGADPDRIKAGNYYAYELNGLYGFSASGDDAAVKVDLKKRVEFLVTDAPSLAGSINLKTPVGVTDLAAGYRNAQHSAARGFSTLVCAGKNLTRTPVVEVDFGPGKGRMIISQLLTAGRLAHGFGEAAFYGIRYDECTAQMTLNMMNELLTQ